MATIYTISITLSFLDENYKKTSTNHSVSRAFTSREEADKHLLERAQSYYPQMSESRYNRMEMSEGRLCVDLHNEDRSIIVEWVFVISEVQLFD